MKHLKARELQLVFEAGLVLSVSLWPAGDGFEVRIVTATGDSVLVGHGKPQPLRFPDESNATLLLNRLGIFNIDTAEVWEIAKIKSSLAGLRNGSNRVFTVDEWAAIRAARKANRGLS